MRETRTSGLMSGGGKPPAACRSRSSALPRLYALGRGRAVSVYLCSRRLSPRGRDSSSPPADLPRVRRGRGEAIAGRDLGLVATRDDDVFNLCGASDKSSQREAIACRSARQGLREAGEPDGRGPNESERRVQRRMSLLTIS